MDLSWADPQLRQAAAILFNQSRDANDTLSYESLARIFMVIRRARAPSCHATILRPRPRITSTSHYCRRRWLPFPPRSPEPSRAAGASRACLPPTL